MWLKYLRLADAPKEYRFTICKEVHDICCNLIYSVRLANSFDLGSTDREEEQAWVMGLLQRLDDLLSVIRRCRCITLGQEGFFPTKKSCIDCKSFTERYLAENELGVRLHPRKTAYAPIKRGFNFCGWHYRLREDESIEVKLRQDKKTLKKKEMKAKQKAYETGRIS